MPRLLRPLRTLFRTPLVTLVAIVSLALGIGANAAIFSMFDTMVLRPLPVPEPDRLVNLSSPGPKPGMQSTSQAGNIDEVFSYPMLRDLQHAKAPVFTGIAAHRDFRANLAYRGETLDGVGMLVSGNYFEVLGLQPAAGRLLGGADEGAPGANPVAVLGYEYWTDRFHANPSVVGDALVVNGQHLTIVGVAPRGFESTSLGMRPKVYVPVTMRAQMVPGWTGFENRRSYWLYLFARLRPGVSAGQAETAINVPYHAIVTDVEAPLQQGVSDRMLAEFKAKRLTLREGRRGQSIIHREAKPPLLMLLAVTGVVLLIACANIANLLLARGATRSAEMAIRLSIGASRRQLVAQLLGESCLLAALGAALGMLVAHWTLALVSSILPPEAASALALGVDGRVWLFSAGLAILTGLLFGLFPALHSTRANLVGALKNSAGQPSGARSAKWFRTTLATAQITLSMTLLVCAGLFTKSLVNVSRVDLGLRTENVIKFTVSPELNGYPEAQSHQLFGRLEDDLRALPGAIDVTASMVPLVAQSSWGNDVSVQGYQAGPDADRVAMFNKVGPGFFRTMGVRLLAGREFTASDGPASADVAIVNEAFAKKFNLRPDAVVGKRMALGDGPLAIQIVGLVQDAKYSHVKRAAPPTFYLPYRQDTSLGAMTFYLRARKAPEQLAASIRAAVKRLDPNLPVTSLETLEQQVRHNVFIDRLLTTLSAAFASLATLLAAVGLYGVLAYTVAQRTREIGLRMALGADAGRVRAMVLRQVAWMAVTGGLVGLGAAAGIGRVARSMLFEVQGQDPLVFAGAAVALAFVALGAGFVPAYRASRIDPIRALRYE